MDRLWEMFEPNYKGRLFSSPISIDKCAAVKHALTINSLFSVYNNLINLYSYLCHSICSFNKIFFIIQVHYVGFMGPYEKKHQIYVLICVQVPVFANDYVFVSIK